MAGVYAREFETDARRYHKHALDCLLMQRRIAHDPAFAHFAFLELELRFDEYQELTAWSRCGGHSREHFCNGDERNIHRDELCGFPDVVRLEISRVPFDHNHALVLLQLPIQLIRGDVHCVHTPCTVLQKTIRKSAV